MGYPDVKKMILDAARKSGRDPNSVRLLAVSKTKSPEDVRRIYDAGQRTFAENYVDELIAKAGALGDLPDIRWVFIGQLQSNKIQKLLPFVSEIQTIASEKHARYIERYASELNRNVPVWIHVNAESEVRKFGTDPATALSIGTFIQASCPHLKLQGVMAIPPAIFTDASYQNQVPPLYLDLRNLANKIGAGKLSLGMSGDLNIAIAAGSDCVRIGTAIFGARSGT